MLTEVLKIAKYKYILYFYKNHAHQNIFLIKKYIDSNDDF